MKEIFVREETFSRPYSFLSRTPIHAQDRRAGAAARS